MVVLVNIVLSRQSKARVEGILGKILQVMKGHKIDKNVNFCNKIKQKVKEGGQGV